MPAGRLGPVPDVAAWRHHGLRDATEVVRVARVIDGWELAGVVVGVEDAVAWALSWEVRVDARWATTSVRVQSRLPGEPAEVRLTRDDEGWLVDGVRRPDLDGVVDVDLEASAMTNTLPLHRLELADRTTVPAAYVRLDLSVRRLDQAYGPARPGPAGGWVVGYEAAEFGAGYDLAYDDAGLVRDYPGLATRLL